MLLHNRVSRQELIEKLNKEDFKRTTFSFYRYFNITEPQEFRDHIYKQWSDLNAYGRIYIASEGINAQMSVPDYNLEKFLELLGNTPGLKKMPIKYAVKDDGKSFYKLIIKVKAKIVADGLSDNSFDASKVGQHLEPKEFHELSDKDDTIVIDMRNHYESEVGKFVNAYCPDADTFKEAIEIVETEFEDKKDKKILLYCTGGIRCEKASAYLKHKGFEDVNQLHGGIIAYANTIIPLGLKSKFTGKNFVFDERLGESVDGKVISKCHQCGKPSDNHLNCANDDCHLLFIQCEECKEKYNACCSFDCKNIISLAPEERQKYKLLRSKKYAESKIYKSRIRPKLMAKIREGIEL